MGDDGCCGENAELSNVDGQSLPTVTNEYRSIGSGLGNSKRKICVSRGLMVGVEKLNTQYRTQRQTYSLYTVTRAVGLYSLYHVRNVNEFS